MRNDPGKDPVPEDPIPEEVPTSILHPDATYTIPVNYEMPEVIEEETLTEPDPVVHQRPFSLTYEVVPSGTKRGKNKLVDSLGYTYNLKRQSQYIVDWQCTVRSKNLRCRATVKQRGSHFTAGSHPHVHQAEVGSLAKLSAAVKAAGRSEVFKSAGAIVQEVLTQHTAEIFLPKSVNLERVTNRHRQKRRPNHPHDLEFDVDYDHIPDDFLQEDMVVNERRHLLFASPHQLALLRNARRWYVDGTFKVVKAPFTQLLSVHAFLRQGDSVKQVPLAFMLMSGRNQSDYKAVFS